MDIEFHAGTAGQCAGNLIAALTKGSREAIKGAFDEALQIASEPAWDSLEEEYRGVLAGILRAMPTQEHNHQVIIRLLRHVAANAPDGPRYNGTLVIPQALACQVC